jgi:hypothetical protein
MARKLIRTSVMLLAVSGLVGVAGCSCHKSTSYDGDCGLVYDDDYWQGDCGGCGAPSGHQGSHQSSCGGCGGPATHTGCSHPHGNSGSCAGCGGSHHQPGPTCASCGGVHTQPAPAPVTGQVGCPHCGVDHGPASEGAPPAEPAPPAGTTASPPPPPLPPSIPPTPGDKPPAAEPAKPKADGVDPTAVQVPPPLQTVPAGGGGLEPAPPLHPVEVPLPGLENPAPIPRDAAQPKWIPRRL